MGLGHAGLCKPHGERCFVLFCWLHRAACRILVPWLGIHRTRAPYSGSMGLQPLDHQGSSWRKVLSRGFHVKLGFPSDSIVKNPPANAGASGDAVLIPGSGRSPGGENANPLQYSYQGNPMDRWAWWATVHGVIEGQTRLKWLSTSCKISISRNTSLAAEWRMSSMVEERKEGHCSGPGKKWWWLGPGAGSGDGERCRDLGHVFKEE